MSLADATTAGAHPREAGWEIYARDGAGWVQARDPDGGVGLNFQADDAYERPTWPEEPDHQAKMMHFELLVDDLEAAVQLVLRLGGDRHRISHMTVIRRGSG